MESDEFIAESDRAVLDAFLDSMTHGNLRLLEAGLIASLGVTGGGGGEGGDKPKMSIDAFALLFQYDVTFGGFGIPIPQYDTFLNVVAMTAFQPYDDDTGSICKDPESVISVLTPIYRILSVLAAITMHRSGFEGLDKISVDRILPYKPRTAFTQQRYGSLLEVALSMWFNVCHAYVDHADDKTIKFFACPPGVSSVWIDFNTANLVVATAQDDLTAAGPLLYLRQQVIAKSSAPLEQLPLAIVINEYYVCYPERGSTMVPIANRIELDNLKKRGAIWFETSKEAPYIEIVGGDTGQNFMLLLTSAGGHYSTLFRNSKDTGDLVSYPVYLHPLLASQSARLKEDYSTASATTLAVAGQIKDANGCVVCGALDRFLTKNDKDKRFYCGERCVAQAIKMEKLRTAAAVAAIASDFSSASTGRRKSMPPKIIPSSTNGQRGTWQ